MKMSGVRILSSLDVERVNSVHSFWFDGDQNVNYRTKWFPEGNSDIQSRADDDVLSLFGSYLTDAMEGNLNHWQDNTKSCIALIIVLDQFSRHIFRAKKLPADATERKQADALALQFAKQLHENSSVTLNLPMAEYVFSLMPLRHTATIDHLTFILSNLKSKENMEANSMELLNKFRKQTVRRLQHLQDREKLEATDDILERSAFQADESDIMSHKLVKTTEAFLLKHLYGPDGGPGVATTKVKSETAVDGEGVTLLISLSGGVDSMVLCKILKLLKSAGKLNVKEVLGIHIDYANRPESGREADYVRSWCEELGIAFRVRVINEVTRGITSRDEYEKVARDIRYQFYQECIQEIQNNNSASNSSRNSNSDSGENNKKPSFKCGVMFGHHQGDVQENVISNVMRGASPLDLSGMTESSVSNSVIVWRPLLTHTKDDIYDFAHKYGVPYFKDSTPSWSTRGKLRNQLIPLLTEMYGAGCLRNLSSLAAESDQVRELVSENIYEPFMRSVHRYPCGLKVNILPYRHQPLCFWKEVLKTLMHSMHMCMVRDKAVINFVQRIQKNTTTGTAKNKQQQQSQGRGGNSTIKSGNVTSTGGGVGGILPGWLELRKGFHTLLTEDGYLIILKDNVLRKDSVMLNSTTANQLLQKQGKLKAKSTATTPSAVTTANTPKTPKFPSNNNNRNSVKAVERFSTKTIKYVEIVADTDSNADNTNNADGNTANANANAGESSGLYVSTKTPCTGTTNVSFGDFTSLSSVGTNSSSNCDEDDSEPFTVHVTLNTSITTTAAGVSGVTAVHAAENSGGIVKDAVTGAIVRDEDRAADNSAHSLSVAFSQASLDEVNKEQFGISVTSTGGGQDCNTTQHSVTATTTTTTTTDNNSHYSSSNHNSSNDHNNVVQIGSWEITFEAVDTTAAPVLTTQQQMQIAREHTLAEAIAAGVVHPPHAVSGGGTDADAKMESSVKSDDIRTATASASVDSVDAQNAGDVGSDKSATNKNTTVFEGVRVTTAPTAVPAAIATNLPIAPTSYRNIKKQNVKKLGCDKAKILTELDDILHGHFTYTVTLPTVTLPAVNVSSVKATDVDVDATEAVSSAAALSGGVERVTNGVVDLVLLDSSMLSAAAVSDVNTSPLSLLNIDMHKIEARLREGLPLLVPSVNLTVPYGHTAAAVQEEMGDVEVFGVNGSRVGGGQCVKLTYRFVEDKRAVGVAGH